MFTPSIIGSGLAGYRFLQSTQDTQLAAFERSPEIARDTAHFKNNILNVETADQLLEDRTLLRVALGAFGLEEDINNISFLRDVLESDLNDRTSAANRLTDKRYFALAQTFNFAGTAANLPDVDETVSISSQLQQLSSPEQLILNTALLDRTLRAFDLTQYEDQTVFLTKVLSSDLGDTSSLVYRLEDERFLALAQAFQGEESSVSTSLLSVVSSTVATRLQALETSDDLLSNTSLLTSVLSVYGLEGQANNTYFLKQVLDSDLRDPASFANSLDDTRYVELAEAFGFQQRLASSESVFGFADAFRDKLTTLNSADDLLDDPTLLQAALDAFGLEDVDEDFLKSVLESDLTDINSVASKQEDPRYFALSQAFGFGSILDGATQSAAQSRVQALIDAADARRSPPADVAEFFSDPLLLLATLNFYDVPIGERETRQTGRILEAYATDPSSPVIPAEDTIYRALYDGLNFQPTPEGRTIPRGFAEAVTENYLERQFEIAVGEIDPELRIAMSLERELTEAVDRVSTNDGRWFIVMASTPLRTIFETTFSLPNSFGTLDVERQLIDLKSASQQKFGTSDLEALLAPGKIEQIRQAYLTGIDASIAISGTASSSAVTLLGGTASASTLNLLL